MKVNPDMRGVVTIAKPNKILILKNRALGDSVLGLSSVQYLKSIFPKAHITYGVPKWVLPLYQNVQTSADSYLPIEMEGIGHAAKMFKKLKKEGFDLILELHQSGRMAKFFNLYKLFNSSPYVFHNHNLGMNDHKKGHPILDQGVRKANIQRDLDACFSAASLVDPGILNIPDYLNYSPKMELSSPADIDPNLIIFGIVATRKEKMWPLTHFHKLAKTLSHKKILIPLSPSKSDQDLKEEFLKLGRLENIEFLIEPLNKLPEVFSKASLYIGNDTGLKHICAALGVATFTLFGPEEPLEWHPYDENCHPFFWVHGHDVRSKVNYLCALKQFDNSKTLNQISSEEVFEFLKDRL